MKKILTVLLVLVMTAGLFGCTAKQPAQSPAEQASAGGFRVGYSRVIMTPEEPIGLGGFGSAERRIFTDVLDDIYVTCIAITDANDNTILLMPVDMQRLTDSVVGNLRMACSNATGVPQEQIFITSSHTHSIPAMEKNSDEYMRFKTMMVERFYQAAEEAMADRKPAQIYTGRIEAEGMNFVKHYQYVDENGEIQHFGDNFGTPVYNETTQHVKEPYDDMLLLQFKREGAKDVVVCNWRAHPTMTGGVSEYNLSSDYIGPLREAVELELDCNFAFVQGACGNINPRSRIAEENFGTEKNYREYGSRLAQYCIDGIQNNMESREPGKVQSKIWRIVVDVDHSQDHLLTQAKLVRDMWERTGNNSSETSAYARQYGISSSYHATAIVVKYEMGETQDIELGAFSLGEDLGFFVGPGELFDDISIEMEKRSPFPITYTVGYADGDWKYFLYGVCAEYDSYERHYGRFQAGTAEKMLASWTEVLNELYANVAE